MEVIKPILARTCFIAHVPELGYSRKNPNRGCWNTFFEKGHTFLVTLPLEIPDKMKFLPWKFHQIIRPKTKTHRNSTVFFSWSCLEISLLFLLTPGVSRFYFFNSPGNSMSTPPPMFFSRIAIEVVTASQTKICKLFWTRPYALDNEPKPYCLTFVLVLCQSWQPCNNELLKYIMQFTAKDGWQTILLVVKTCVIDWSTWYLHQEFGVTGQYWCRSLSVSLLGPLDHVKIYFPEAFCISFSLTIFDWMATP